MPKTDASPGPLEKGWRLLHEMLRRSERNEAEIEAFRMTFYLGARTTIDAAVRSPMALMHVAAELRAVDKHVAAELRAVDKKLKTERLEREVSICPVVNIS
jgi:hypothetical protein